MRDILVYEAWIKEFKSIELEQLAGYIRQNFLIGLETYSAEEQDNFLESRVKEIKAAQWETDRRLSVAYTNLGLIYYHHDNFERAADLFNQALELWGDNLNAENNLNSMLGRPLTKRNFIQKMFPKSRR